MTYLKTFKTMFLSIFDSIGMMILLFIGPLFLTLFFGGVYLNNYVEDMPVAILDEDDSALSRMVNEQFVQNQRFLVEAYPSSRQELESLIDNGDVHVGLWIPKGFEEGATTFESAEVLLFVDGTNLVVSNNAYAQAATIIQTLSAGIEMRLIQGKGMTPNISEKIALVYNVGERVLYDSKMTYMNYLIIPFLAVFLQQLYMAGMGSLLLRNQEEIGQDKSIFMTMQRVAGTASACIVGFIPATILCMLALKNWFSVPMVGNLFAVALMTIVFLLALTGPAMILASYTKDRVTYSQFSLMLSLPTFVASGCVWPVEQMPKLLENLIRFLWPLINYAKLAQEIVVKGREFSSVTTNMIQLVAYMVFWGIIGLVMYRHTFGGQSNQIKSHKEMLVTNS